MTVVDELRLNTSKKATFFNKSLLIGVLAGVCGTIFGQLWGLTGALSVLGTGIVAGSVFAVIEQRQNEKDNNKGKIIKKPTFWNKDMLLGGLLGFISGNIVEATLLPTGGLLPCITMMSGAAAGGNAGKTQMEKEYKQALSLKQLNVSSTINQQPLSPKSLETAPEKQQINDNKFEESIIQERLKKEMSDKVR